MFECYVDLSREFEFRFGRLQQQQQTCPTFWSNLSAEDTTLTHLSNDDQDAADCCSRRRRQSRLGRRRRQRLGSPAQCWPYLRSKLAQAMAHLSPAMSRGHLSSCSPSAATATATIASSAPPATSASASASSSASVSIGAVLRRLAEMLDCEYSPEANFLLLLPVRRLPERHSLISRNHIDSLGAL